MDQANADQAVDFAVISGRFDSIAKEMGIVLEKSARSPIFAEACDFSCGITDCKGELISQLSGIPILAAAGGYSVKAILTFFGDDLEEGDIFILNDPYYGGNHLPDIGIISPFFDQGVLVAFCVSRAHHGDIGGSTAGSYNAKATEIYQEGLRIPPLRLGRRDAIIPDVLSMIANNTRNPIMFSDDLLAQIGANRIGLRRLQEMTEHYGRQKINFVMEELLAQGERLVRSRVAQLPDGVYCGEEYFDDDGFQAEPIRIHVAVTIAKDQIMLDFSQTDSQVKGFVNTSFVTAVTAAKIGLLWALGADIPRNGGAFAAIDVNVVHGSLLNPKLPAPMTLCTLTPAGEIIAAVFKALSSIALSSLPAGFARFCGPSFFGTDPRNQNMYVGFAFCALGAGGALPGRDGNPYMSPISNYGGVRTPDIESNEIQYPHITVCHELEPDTAGPGQWRGGAGVRYSIAFYDHQPGIVMFGDGMKIPPYGLAGGLPGKPSQVFIGSGEQMQHLASKEGPVFLQSDQVFTILSAGGGGYGDWQKRTAQAWEDDVRDGIYTRDFIDQLWERKDR